MFKLLNILLLLNINNILGYNELFNSWLCVGIKENINFNKPYAYNIGKLPLVLWKNKDNELLSTINVCRHMGSKLDNGIILDNGCLQCQYHGLEYSKNDIIGKTIEYEGKIFWSYKPTEKTPYSVPFMNNNKYTHSFLQIDMKASLLDSAYNTLDLLHPSYVHNKIVGFGSLTPAMNIKNYIYKDNKRLGLSFTYETNKMIKQIIEDTQTTDNYHQYVYPTFTWSRVTTNKKNNIFIAVNLLPISPKTTRWFITINHNFYTSFLGKEFIKTLALTILTQDYIQMNNQYEENKLKKEILFKYSFEEEKIIHALKNMMNKYNYPDINNCLELYKDYSK